MLFSMRSEKEDRVLEAATAVFLRYGYRRTTMGDLAAAAGISRPALYLLFCNKERIFDASLRRLFAGLLDRIQAETAVQETPLQKLRIAFELWAVQPFALMQGSPDARDLVNCGFEFAEDAMVQGYTRFEALLASILEPLPRAAGTPGPEQTARVLAASVRGFKGAARSVEELRELIEGLLALTLQQVR
jgi:AcrR family transcriptional regulator